MRVGIFSEAGKNVLEKDALQYAMDQISTGSTELKDEFIEWFYSGDWVKEEDNEDRAS